MTGTGIRVDGGHGLNTGSLARSQASQEAGSSQR